MVRATNVENNENFTQINVLVNVLTTGTLKFLPRVVGACWEEHANSILFIQPEVLLKCKNITLFTITIYYNKLL